MTGGVPLTIALVAGGLATLNPCGFPLLPAFLSFYVGASEGQLPRAPGRIAQGLLCAQFVPSTAQIDRRSSGAKTSEDRGGLDLGAP